MTKPAGLFSLDGLSALVTGAGRGIGAEIAVALADCGATVHLMSRSADDLQQLAARIDREGGRAVPVVCDVTRPEHVEAALDGIARLDVLVNNAGTNHPEAFVEVTAEQLDAMLSLNVRAMFTVAQAGVRKMLGNGEAGGAIINMSSQMGHVGAPRRTVYCMTKHAIEGLTKAMSVELAPLGIRVNTVAPTFVETPMTQSFFEQGDFREWVLARLPAGRMPNAAEVAAAVCYLASPAAALVTGTSLRIDGGWTAQ
ncbi:SDR family NAD(P)-dependent oxidoreductase [Burkholderia gladioli]|uniref:SDR family NAD(P)-dependent oxidoreductase n=1 Tax=Burkholderia gladioli TaxID=28095 RepID=UPI00163E7632|nr:SDR family oxidoreductase [Burkholderia gladioli]